MERDVRPALRQRAAAMLQQLPAPQREALLISCWMSHDARWFMAVANECGMDVANRLNQIAAREIGRVEARRIVSALGIPPVATLDDYLLAQEALISLLGPELLDYHVVKAGETEFQVRVSRCFAYENATRAGIADQYRCGIFARLSGWSDALGLQHEMTPTLGRCLKAQGRECAYTFKMPQDLPAGRA